MLTLFIPLFQHINPQLELIKINEQQRSQAYDQQHKVGSDVCGIKLAVINLIRMKVHGGERLKIKANNFIIRIGGIIQF